MGYLGEVFFGDERGELEAEALHVLPPLPLDLLPLHRRRRCAAAIVVARVSSPTTFCLWCTATAAPLHIHLSPAPLLSLASLPSSPSSPWIWGTGNSGLKVKASKQPNKVL